MTIKIYAALMAVTSISLSVSSCAKAKTSTAAAAAASTTTTTTTTTSTAVTVASLDGGSTAAWMSSCLSFTPLTSGSTATYHQYVLIFSGSNYYFYDNWFNNSSCTVVSGELFYLSSSGAYTIGSTVSGSSTLYNIQFTASGSSIYPLSYVSSGTAAATWLTSTGCSAAGTFSAGTQKTATGYDCGVSEMPAANEVSNNVIQLSGSNIYIGAPSLYYVTPGVFASALAGDKDGGATQTTPTTASVLMVPCSGSVCGVD